MSPTILIIDDSETTRARLQRVLSGRGVCNRFLVARDGTQGLKLLLEQPVDLIVCDLVMPGMDGFKFLSLKNSRKEYGDVPVIMLTGRDQQSLKVRGLEAGASDYLIKPFDDEELVARVKIHLHVKMLQDELRDQHAKLEAMSRTDLVTGALSHSHFLDLVEGEFQRALRYRMPLSYVLVDIDRFKQLNDGYGHAMGDQALRRVASVLRDGLRLHDMVGRCGGGRFGVLLPQTPAAGAALVAERFRSAIERETLVLGEARASITAHIGVATFPDPEIHSAAELMSAAGASAQQAKRVA